MTPVSQAAFQRQTSSWVGSPAVAAAVCWNTAATWRGGASTQMGCPWSRPCGTSPSTLARSSTSAHASTRSESVGSTSIPRSAPTFQARACHTVRCQVHCSTCSMTSGASSHRWWSSSTRSFRRPISRSSHPLPCATPSSTWGQMVGLTSSLLRWTAPPCLRSRSSRSRPGPTLAIRAGLCLREAPRGWCSSMTPVIPFAQRGRAPAR